MGIVDHVDSLSVLNRGDDVSCGWTGVIILIPTPFHQVRK